jgi:PKHD-type hydroxylase
MYLTNEWYIYERALNKKTCNKIIKLGDKKFEESTVGHDILDGAIDKKIRISKVAWSNDQWLYDLIWPYMEGANAQSGWKYDIKAAEPMQIAQYKKGGFYGFHRDGRSDSLSAYDRPDLPLLHGNVRKLSMSIILNNNYDGGQLQFITLDQHGEAKIHTPKNQNTGCIIIFPSFMAHKVKPVTRGVRYSFVSWFVGPPFK